MKKKDIKKRRSKNWCLILYPDNESHCEIFARITNNYFSCATILHDQDYVEGLHDNEFAENGLKKSHWHILITFENARYFLPLCEELGLSPEDYHLLCECHSVKGYLKYMIHYGYDDKYQYSKEELFCNDDLYMKLVKAMKVDRVEEEIRVKQIKKWIFDNDSLIDESDLFDFCVDNGYYSDYRRSSIIFHKLLLVHNKSILNNISNDKGDFLYD